MDLGTPLVEWTDCVQAVYPCFGIHLHFNAPCITLWPQRVLFLADNVVLKEHYVCNGYVVGGQKVKYLSFV